MLLNLTKQSKERILVDAVTETGSPLVVPKIVHRYKEKDIRWLANLNPASWTVPEVNLLLMSLCEDDSKSERAIELDISEKDFVKLFDNYKKKEEPQPEQQFGLTEDNPFVLHVRGLNQLKKYAEAYSDVDPGECLKRAFTNTPEKTSEPIIEWSDVRFLCCLDIDYHNLPMDNRPTIRALRKIIDRIKCQPFCWHPSHGNGAKLYYVYKPGFQADELASIAGLQWTQEDGQATFDLTKSTRHPHFPRLRDFRAPPCSKDHDIYYVFGSSDVTYLKRILTSEIEQTEIDAVLQEKGWRLGQMLPHSECLIQPSNSHKENVFVGETGLYCHHCASKGLGFGDRPGYYSYARMIGGSDNRMLTMVRNFVHLDHARVVLQNLYPTVAEKTLTTIYKCLLKIVHSYDDPRIPRAMTAGKGYVRSNGEWRTLDGSASVEKGLAAFVNSLPCTMIPTDKGFAKNVSAITALSNTGNLDQYGYQSITFIRGCRIYGQFLPYGNDEIIRTVVRREFDNCKPNYESITQRMPIKEAWSLIESEFPGIDRSYLQLLICAKGSSEGRLAQCPFLLVTGPSSAGKSTTVHIAAGICGDKADEPTYSPFPDRFRQNLMESAANSEFVVINEVFKEAMRMRLSPTQALDPMLTLTEDSRSHKMYVGPKAFGRLPIFVLTDINIPQEVKEDVQLARRFTFYQLRNRINWSDTLISRGIRPHQIRLLSSEHSRACNSILSDIIDTHFRRRRSLAEIAKDLGIQSLEHHSEAVHDTSKQLCYFYKAVCEAPLHNYEKDKRDFPSVDGWRRIDRISDSPLRELWEELCDDTSSHAGWTSSRKVDSQDWQKITGVTDFPIECQVRIRKHCIYVRFASTESVRQPKWINGMSVKYTDRKG